MSWIALSTVMRSTRNDNERARVNVRNHRRGSRRRLPDGLIRTRAPLLRVESQMTRRLATSGRAHRRPIIAGIQLISLQFNRSRVTRENSWPPGLSEASSRGPVTVKFWARTRIPICRTNRTAHRFLRRCSRSIRNLMEIRRVLRPNGQSRKRNIMFKRQLRNDRGHAFASAVIGVALAILLMGVLAWLGRFLLVTLMGQEEVTWWVALILTSIAWLHEELLQATVPFRRTLRRFAAWLAEKCLVGRRQDTEPRLTGGAKRLAADAGRRADVGPPAKSAADEPTKARAFVSATAVGIGPASADHDG
jgi:hypothetical protein